MKTNNELNRQRWRDGLFSTFKSEGHSRDNCIALAEKFDQVSEKLSGENSAAVIYAAYGSNDVKKVCRTIKDFVESQLEQFNASHVGISTDSATRLKKAIQKLADNIDNVSIVFNGQELTAKEIDAIKPKLPLFCRSMTVHQASASSKSAGLSIEVII